VIYKQSYAKRVIGLVCCLLLAGSIVACRDDSFPTQLLDPSKILFAVDLNHQAVLLSTTPPYDTLQLVITPRNAQGDVIADSVLVTYTSGHPSVEVSPTGLLTAKAVRQFVQVIVRVSYNMQTRIDTVFVRVTGDANPPQMVVYGFDVSEDDSLKISPPGLFPNNHVLRVRGLDANGDPIPDIIVKYSLSDQTMASLDPITGDLVGIRPGKVTIYATSTVYGVIRRDSIQYTIGNPMFAQIAIVGRTPIHSRTVIPTFDPEMLIVGTGAVVLFNNISGELVDVVFDEPDKIDAFPFNIPPFIRNDELSGNISPFAPDSTGSNTRYRVFNHPGIYPFHSTLHGVSGKIIVQ
jgi:hypothetical protein